MKYIKKLIRNSKRALNQQVIKNKQEIVKYAPRLTGIQVLAEACDSYTFSCPPSIAFPFVIHKIRQPSKQIPTNPAPAYPSEEKPNATER